MVLMRGIYVIHQRSRDLWCPEMNHVYDVFSDILSSLLNGMEFTDGKNNNGNLLECYAFLCEVVKKCNVNIN